MRRTTTKHCTASQRLESQVFFWFLAEREDDAFDVNGGEVMVRAEASMEQVPLESALTAASSVPLTLQAALTSSVLFCSR